MSNQFSENRPPKTKKLRILYCTGSLYTPGGAERVLINKANALSEAGHTVGIVTADQKQKPFCYPVSERIKLYDAAIGTLFTEPVIPLLSARLTFPKILRRYQQIVDEFQPDIIIGNELGYDDELLPKLKTKAKKIREFHSSHEAVRQMIASRKGRDRMRTARINRKSFESFRNFDCLVLLTEEDLKHSPHKVRTVAIPNMVPAEEYPKAEGFSKKVISVGRLDRLKNHRDQILAWEAIAAEFPDWTLHIYGEGPEKNNLQQMINERGLGNHVFLEGRSDVIHSAYSQSAFMLFTSLAEGFGMVVIEAMQHGLPVISYRTPCGPSEIISDGADGFLVEMAAVEELRDKIKILIGNPSLRSEMAENARKKSNNYTPPAVLPMWEELFYSLTHGS